MSQGEIGRHVKALEAGNAGEAAAAVKALGTLACDHANRAAIADAANRAMRLHTHSLKVVDGDAEGAEGSESSEAAAEPPLTAEGAARIRRDLTSGEAWAESVAALRRGREKILEELLRVSR